MTPTRSRIQTTAAFYLLIILPGAFNLKHLPTFIVRGDAAATARNIADASLAYRLTVLSGVVGYLAFVYLAFSLYEMFKDVDRKQARLLVGLVLVMVTLGLVNQVNELAPLVLLNHAASFAAFTKPQLDALTLGFLQLRNEAFDIGMALWGLWLLPFGVLAWKSGWIPKTIGVLLVLDGFAWIALCVTGLVFPANYHVVDMIAMPFYTAGELSVLGWLLVKSVTMPSTIAAGELRPVTS
jgi:Domain of unknown function (DUF4386)